MKSTIFATLLSVAMAQRGYYDPHYSPRLPHGRAPHAPHAEYAPHDPHRSEAFMKVMQRPRSAFHDPLNRMNVNKPLGRAFDSEINLKGR